MRKSYVEWLERLKPLQLLNHLPNWEAVADKGLLAEHLRHFDRVQSKYDFGMKDLVQETFCLYIPEERARFFGQLPSTDSQEILWILKPCASSRGRGIEIMWQFDELRESYSIPRATISTRRPSALSSSGTSGTRSFSMGASPRYGSTGSIASVDPLLVLMYREGTVRLNSKPFRSR